MIDKEAWQSDGVSIRRMVETDLPSVIANEQAAYEYPWSAALLADCLALENYSCAVLEVATEQGHNTVIGHCIASAVLPEAHLLNICIHPLSQGRGHGRLLLNWIIEAARRKSVETLFLEVRASNQVAVGLYENMGFVRIGERAGYYESVAGSREDAVVMALSIPRLT